MKYHHTVCFSFMVVASHLHAAGYSTGFNKFQDGITDYPNFGNVAGLGGAAVGTPAYDGWSISDSTNGLSFMVSAWLPGQGQAAGLGGISSVPTGATVGLFHDVGAVFGETRVALDFAIIDTSNDFPNRDTFGISLTNSTGTADLFTVLFVPEVTQPGDPSGDTNAKWNLYYQYQGGPTIPTAMAIFEGTNPYNFDLQFTPNGVNTDFNLTITSGVNFLNKAGLIPIAPSLMTGNFGLTWTPTTPGSEGENYFVMDNLSVIPEPSSVLLLCLAGLGLVSRRRRA